MGLILGSLRMPALLKSVGETAHRAVGTNLVVGVCVGAAGLIGHAPEGVDWELLALGGAASIPGAVLGARLTGRLSTEQLLRAIGALLVVAGVGILISAASPADARASASAPALADRIAEPWPERQAAAGSFADYMAPRGARSRDLYGHAMMGYGLLATGLQRSDRRLVNSGLRGLVYAVDHPRPFHSVVFEKLALAAGYNLARTRAESNPRLRGCPLALGGAAQGHAPDLARPGAQPVLQPAPRGRGHRARAGSQRRRAVRDRGPPGWRPIW